MNKQNLRPCMGGWLLIAGGILSILYVLFDICIELIFHGMPMYYLTQMLGYALLPTLIYALPQIAIGIMLVMKKRGIPIAIVCGVGVIKKLMITISVGLSNLCLWWRSLFVIICMLIMFLV